MLKRAERSGKMEEVFAFPFRQQRIYVNQQYKLNDEIFRHKYGMLKNLNRN